MTRATAKRRGLVNRRELAQLFDVHVETITKWQDYGLPVAVRGGRGRESWYDEAACRSWLDVSGRAAVAGEGKVDATRERARKDRAQALLAEQMHALRSGDLVSVQEVAKVWSGEVAAVRTRLLAWAQTLADRVYRVAQLEGVSGVEREIDSAVREVLTELSDPLAPRGEAA